MSILSRALLLFAVLISGWAEEAPARQGRDFVLPSVFEHGRIRLVCTSDVTLEERKGPDFFVYSVRPTKEPTSWSFSLYDGNHPQPLKPKSDRRREWHPFNLLNWLQLHPQPDGGLLAESYIPAGHELDIDDKTGGLKWVHGNRQIHVWLSVHREADFEKALTSLQLSWEPIPKP